MPTYMLGCINVFSTLRHRKRCQNVGSFATFETAIYRRDLRYVVPKSKVHGAKSAYKVIVISYSTEGEIKVCMSC